MKPYITPEMTLDKKSAFNFQWEGITREEFGSRLSGQKLVAYVIPEGHDFREAWNLLLILESGMTLDFSSACSRSVGWHEVGSLNINLLPFDNGSDENMLVSGVRVSISPIDLVAIDKIIYEDDDVVVECGLILRGSNEDVTICAGISPGSISLSAPFTMGQLFAPQFPLSICRVERL